MEYLTLTFKLKVLAADPKVAEARKALEPFGEILKTDLTTYRETGETKATKPVAAGGRS